MPADSPSPQTTDAASTAEPPTTTPATPPVRRRGRYWRRVFAPINILLIGGVMAGLWCWKDYKGSDAVLQQALQEVQQGDFEHAFPKLQQAAAAGNRSAFLPLAECYAEGIGTESNLAKAREWYRAAEQYGDTTASLLLADMDFAAADYAAAVPRYTRALPHLSAEQYYRLATAHMQLAEAAAQADAGRHAELAVRYYTEAAQAQHHAAAYELALLCYKGIGCAASRGAAIHYFTQAAEQGNTEAAFRLAWCYLEQSSPDYALACRWLARAAEQGNIAAAYDLARCYLDGRASDVPAPQLAIPYLLRAAEQQHPAALRTLGFCYRDGVGTARDLPAAISCFGRAAAAGDLESAYNYAWCLHRGFGVQPDIPRAFAAYLYATLCGYSPAQQELAAFRLIKLLPKNYLLWCKNPKIIQRCNFFSI